MLTLLDLPDDAALAAIDEGEFPESIIGRGNVAVVMTQNWCPDWFWMRHWLHKLSRSENATTPSIRVYVLIYNRKPYFADFMRHKERRFGNGLIPYVRCYKDGRYLRDSNQIRPDAFVSIFA